MGQGLTPVADQPFSGMTGPNAPGLPTLFLLTRKDGLVPPRTDPNAIKPVDIPSIEPGNGEMVYPQEQTDATHFLLPLRDVVLFPGMVVPLFIGRQKSAIAVEMAAEQETPIVAVTQKDATLDEPSAADLFSVGTLCNILQMVRLPDGSFKVLLEGVARRRVLSISGGGQDEIPLAARSIPLPDFHRPSVRLDAAVRYVSDLFEN